MNERNLTIADIRRIRHKQSARFGHNTDKYLDHLIKQQVPLPDRRRTRQKAAAKASLPLAA